VDLVEGYVQLAPLGNYLRIHDGDTHRDIREKLAGKLVVSILSHLGEPIRPPQPAPRDVALRCGSRRANATTPRRRRPSSSSTNAWAGSSLPPTRPSSRQLRSAERGRPRAPRPGCQPLPFAVQPSACLLRTGPTGCTVLPEHRARISDRR
jgi:hypothetical protein